MTSHDEPDPWLSAQQLEAWKGLAGLVFLLPSALDSQLRRDSDLTLFEYMILALLSDAEDRTLQMKTLVSMSKGSYSRLSHVVTRLEKLGFVTRSPLPTNRRITVASLTEAGWEKIVAAAPAHVAEVKKLVFDAIEPSQIGHLAAIARQILEAAPTEID